MTKNVLIFPWFMSRSKYLNKYRNMYQNLGYRVYFYNYPLKKGILAKHIADSKNDMLELRKNTHFDIVHSFSGGFYPYFNWITSPGGLSYSNLIVDSAPALPNSNMLSNYFLIYFGLPRILNYAIKPLCNYAVNMDKFERHGLLFKNMEEILKNEDSDKLFINSLNDPYLVPDDIKRIVQKCRENNKVKISEVWFEQSDHCQHYRNYPDEYTNLIKNLSL